MTQLHQELVEANSEQPTSKTRLRKWLPRWPWLLALGILAIGLVTFSLDEKPADVSDLAVERSVIPDSENGVLLLIKVAEEVNRAVHLSSSDSRQLTDIYTGASWDEARAQAWSTEFEPFLKPYADAAGKTLSQFPQPTSLYDSPVGLRLTKQLAALSLSTARKQLREGNPHASLETAFVTLRAGALLERSLGTLQTYHIGGIIKNMALTVIADAARNPGVSKEKLHKILEELHASHDSGGGLGNSIRGEHYFTEKVFDVLDKEGPKRFTAPRMSARISRLLVKLPIIYKRNKSARILNQLHRAAIPLIYQDYTTLLRECEKLQPSAEPTGFSKINPDNFIGRSTINALVPLWRYILSQRLTSESRLSVHEAFIAALLYRQDHGALPATLDLLVPAYLPALPIDYFDKAPIRYSPSLGVVWSTGQNGLDITYPDQRTPISESVLWITERQLQPKNVHPAAETDALTPEPTPTP